jgi:hypothetical protein
MQDMPPPIVTQEIRIVDAQGHPRILLSASSGKPVLVMLRVDGQTATEVSLDEAGRPSVSLANPDPNGPTATLAVDDKGAHVKFDRPGGASSYVFLNNAGGSGVVLIDAKGVRRLQATVDTNGITQIERNDASGSPQK